MGCDIHSLVEEYDITSGEWVTINTMSYIHDPAYIRTDGTFTMAAPRFEQRDYELFAKLAGVRGDGPEPKGLPQDLSQTGYYFTNRYGDDGHSHSWMLADELVPLLNKHYGVKKDASEYFGSEVGDDLSRVRVVFWFDN